MVLKRPRSNLMFLVLMGVSLGGHGIVLYQLPALSLRNEVQSVMAMTFFEAPKPVELNRPTAVSKPKNLPRSKPKSKSHRPIKSVEPNRTRPNEVAEKSIQPVPIVFGVSLTTASNVGDGPALPTGNSTLGIAGRHSGAGVSTFHRSGAVDTEARVKVLVKIPYPEEAKRNDAEGAVKLRVTIDEQGTVVNVIVLSGPGHGLNEAARDALKKFRFTPAMKNGEPVESLLLYTYTFVLE